MDPDIDWSCAPCVTRAAISETRRYIWLLWDAIVNGAPYVENGQALTETEQRERMYSLCSSVMDLHRQLPTVPMAFKTQYLN